MMMMGPGQTGIAVSEETDWIGFLTANGFDESFAFGFGGLGDGEKAYLEPIAWSASEVAGTYSGADDPNVIVVANTSDLGAELVGAIAATATGNVLTGGVNNDLFGADGNGGVVGVRAAGADSTTEVTDGVGDTIVGLYGTLKLGTDGSYTYTATKEPGIKDMTDTFVYTMQDGDGDRSTATLTINVKGVPLELGAWNDSEHTGEYEGDNSDNQTQTFMVSTVPVYNDASAFTWIGQSLQEGRALRTQHHEQRAAGSGHCKPRPTLPSPSSPRVRAMRTPWVGMT